MEQGNVAALLMTINQMQMFVPPYLFTQIVNNPALKLLEMVANGHVQLEAKRPPPPDAPAADAPAAAPEQPSGPPP